MYFQSPQDTGDLYQGYYYFFDDVSPQIDPLRKLLMRHLPVALTYSAAERHLCQEEYNVDCPPKIVSPFLDRLVHFLVALAGGVVIVGPVVIMALRPSMEKSLITVGVSIAVFALFLSGVIRVSNGETLVATATYAAVMVVFVGTSIGGGRASA